MSLGGGDKLLNKVIILVFFAYNKYSRSFNSYGLTTDGRWTIFVMSFTVKSDKLT